MKALGQLRMRLILPAFVGILCACGSASTSGQPSQTPSGGNAGAAVSGNAGATSGGAGSSGTLGAGGSSAGASGSSAGAAGSATSAAGSSGAGAGAGGAGAGGVSGSGNGGTAGSGNSAGSAGMTSTSGPPLVYVGSTNGQILLYSLDATLGKLTLLKSFDAGNYPSFLAFDPSRQHVYAVNEPDAMVASFSVDPKTGYLTFLNRVSSGGAGPAFISVDHSGKYVLVANYDGGTTRIFPISADGSLGTPTDSKSPGMNCHMLLTDPANKFAFVPNLGSDTIAQYAFDTTKGTLTANAVPLVHAAAMSQPRHLAFHPNGKYAYLASEKAHSLSMYTYNAALGQLTFVQSLSSVPAANASGATGAEVVVAPSGNFVYASTRTYDSIATFSIDASGKLALLGNTPSGGTIPRNFTLSADGKLMLVANESGNVTSFSVNVTTGALTKLLSVTVPVAPQFVGIVTLP